MSKESEDEISCMKLFRCINFISMSLYPLGLLRWVPMVAMGLGCIDVVMVAVCISFSLFVALPVFRIPPCLKTLETNLATAVKAKQVYVYAVPWIAQLDCSLATAVKAKQVRDTPYLRVLS